MTAIHSLPPTQLAMPLTRQLQAARVPGGPQESFVGLLARGVDAVNNMQHHADDQVHDLLTGGEVTQAEVLSSVQKADMAFRLLMQVRNKLMAAYEELNAIRV